ncbi:MAG: hypothetical protein ACLPPF_21205 [Rhodomicrobium sp.]
MISSISLDAGHAIERHRTAFREDVAEQLRLAAERAGLASSITEGEAEIVLEIVGGGPDGEDLRIVVRFNDVRDSVPGWCDWITLSAETAGERTPLLTLAWRDDERLTGEENLKRRLAEWEARIDRGLPPGSRGLNAKADVRTGRYGRGSVLGALLRDLQSASGTTMGHEPQAVALPVTALCRQSQSAQALPVIEVSAEPVSPPARILNPLSAAALSERLIAAVLQTMQKELREHEARFAGTGVTSSAKARVSDTIEWAMLGVAYGVEAKTNQAAMASIFKTAGASWLYGLVGPVLIGGLASLSRTKSEKGAALALMACWALAMATITASDKDYLDGAQEWFPKGAAVLLHEKALAAATQEQAGAEKELARLDSKSGNGTAALIVDAKKRWQARELAALEERDKKERETQRLAAAEQVKQARDRVLSETFALKQAVESDASRQWAWRSLFLIFGVINFAGPFAISRVLEKWRTDHAGARKDAQDDHKAREGAAALRHNRATQKARAMLLLPAALSELMEEGIAAGVLASLDQVDVAEKAAERFDRSVNRQKYSRSLLRLLRPAAG